MLFCSFVLIQKNDPIFKTCDSTNEPFCGSIKQMKSDAELLNNLLIRIPIERTDLDAVPNMSHLQTSNKTTSAQSGHQSSHVDFSKSNGTQGISIEDSFNSPYLDSVNESLPQMQDNYNDAPSIATATHAKPSLLLPFNQDNSANMMTVIISCCLLIRTTQQLRQQLMHMSNIS